MFSGEGGGMSQRQGDMSRQVLVPMNEAENSKVSQG